jgi:diguanylate cyclase
MFWSTIRGNPNTVVARIVWPMAAVLFSLLGLAVGGLIWTSERANEIARERQQTQLSRAILNQGQATLRDLGHLVAMPQLQAALTAPSAQAGDVDAAALHAALDRQGVFSAVFVLAADDRVIWGTMAGSPVDQERFDTLSPLFQSALAHARGQAMLAATEATTPTARDKPDPGPPQGVSQLIMAAGEPVFVAAMMVPGGGSEAGFARSYAMGLRPLDAALIGSMGAAHDAPDLRFAPEAAPSGPASLALLDASGMPMGALVWTPDRHGDRVLERVLPAILVALCGVALFSTLMFGHVRRITTELVHREAQATHLAHHDPLSGLPNRALFAKRLDDELERLERGGDALAVLYLDLDRFKEINDNHGHEGGDEVIRTVARRLGDLLRGADTLARFGGDEFAVIQTGVREPRDSEALARRILEAVQPAVPLAEGEAYVGVSIGIALAPENAASRDNLMRLADVALYRAKHEGRNRYSFFETVMDETLKLRKIVEDDLRLAIERDELELRYQPQFSADGRDILGVEALVRWNHPRRGPIPPSDFIPIAEERGLIGPLGEWVLRRAARDGTRWPTITVAVNVSPIQFRHKDFVATVQRIVAEEGLDPARLELELTEGVIVDDADLAEQAMIELRSLGVRMALDDFGTGYSSLIYLRRFAFDKIKIDRSFLEAMETTGESAILIHSVVHLGRALGLTVTAEGVETEEQQRFLQALGCHQMQGYLFCEPVSGAHIDRLLAAPLAQRAGEAA